MSTPESDLEAVIKAARESYDPFTPDPSKPTFVAVPEGSNVQELDLSAWRETPYRKTGVYKPATVEAFLNYAGRHAVLETSTIWVHPTSGLIVAVFDDNDSVSPGWKQHTARLQLAATPQWKHWVEKDNSMMSQTEFAEHIEVGLEDILEPNGAVILEMAQTFHAKTTATFRSGTRLSSGETQFQYDEEIKASAGAKGTLEIPSVIMLGISPFIGEEAYKVIARLRYRINSGHLSLGYKLDRPDLVVRDALEKIATQVGEHFPLTYIGEPPTY